jgi:2,3-bisphosphoglycerate-independent phosphoglycerate mutase
MPAQGKSKRRVFLTVMDGVGVREERFGNAVAMAQTPWLKRLRAEGLYTTLNAHGTYVGLPSNADIGNSEVGHNALGAGRVFDQGAKLVQNAIESGRMYEGPTWRKLVDQVKAHKGTAHFIGLLSDGNVHSHESHLHAMLARCKEEGVPRARVHVLFDGRDVGEKTGETYVERLEKVIGALRSPTFDVRVASGGGRMLVTMDRYEADWSIVKRGWEAHVLGRAPQSFPSLTAALTEFRKDASLVDQNLPPFVIAENGRPVGTIEDGDGVVFFNFRGDRAIEITRAFCDKAFSHFDRVRTPKIFFAGMMQYDGDTHLPENFLVTPPEINDTLGEYMVHCGIRQFACSETQKYGHVTYFWNGNRSGHFSKELEEYLEVPSDSGITFDRKPWMRAYEIAEESLKRLRSGSFDFGRINFANGDMVGHTGNLEASIIAVSVVDLMLGRIFEACRETDTILVVTADHGNADEMYDAKAKDFPDWETLPPGKRPKPKTAHTLSPVPFYMYDPRGMSGWKLAGIKDGALSNVASTVLTLTGLPPKTVYQPSLITQV